jgi:hypothetical protein
MKKPGAKLRAGSSCWRLPAPIVARPVIGIARAVAVTIAVVMRPIVVWAVVAVAWPVGAISARRERAGSQTQTDGRTRTPAATARLRRRRRHCRCAERCDGSQNDCVFFMTSSFLSLPRITPNTFAVPNCRNCRAASPWRMQPIARARMSRAQFRMIMPLQTSTLSGQRLPHEGQTCSFEHK